MPAAKKTNTKKTTSTAKKTTAAKKGAPKKTVVKKTVPKKTTVKKVTPVKAKKVQALKSLRMAPDESHAFMLISTDFDGKRNKTLQVISTLLLLTILGVMVYLAVLANEIANTLITYGWPV